MTPEEMRELTEEVRRLSRDLQSMFRISLAEWDVFLEHEDKPALWQQDAKDQTEKTNQPKQ